MTDFSKNPVEDKIMDYMKRHGQKMDEIDLVLVNSKEDLDKTAKTLGIDPSSYKGNDQAAVVFVKGAVVYGLMDQNERNSFLETLNRVWGKSRFTGEITGAVADRVAGIQNGMDWPDLPNPIFVKEYATVIHAARLIDVPVSGLGWVGFGTAVGGLGNAAVVSKTGKSLIDAGKLAETLGKIGLDGAKVLKGSGYVGAGVTIASFAIEKWVAYSLDQAKQEAENRLLGKAKYTMTEEYFEQEMKKYGLKRDVGAIQ